jgi:hypothetical protein
MFRLFPHKPLPCSAWSRESGWQGVNSARKHLHAAVRKNSKSCHPPFLFNFAFFILHF